MNVNANAYWHWLRSSLPMNKTCKICRENRQRFGWMIACSILFFGGITGIILSVLS